jgi:translation initiation factor 1
MLVGSVMKSKRIDVSGGAPALAQYPFGGLSTEGLPRSAPKSARDDGETNTVAPGNRKAPNRNRGRVDVVRQTAGRGGKTVTVLSGFMGIASRELEDLARAVRKASGAGGTVKDGTIELQGDHRELAEQVLREAGFRPVRAGG